ncbi:MAG: hypothetical protein H7Y17_09710 [Chlorobia bacterium]|nr:hypothetical protein [Fimbriimonadaceae bacterium]
MKMSYEPFKKLVEMVVAGSTLGTCEESYPEDIVMQPNERARHYGNCANRVVSPLEEVDRAAIGRISDFTNREGQRTPIDPVCVQKWGKGEVVRKGFIRAQ